MKIIIILICLLLSGCSDYNEVEDLTIVTAVAIDKISDDELGYKVSVEVAKFSNDKTDVSIVSATGSTFFEAVTQAIKITGNDLYFSHAQVIIISDKVARESIYPFVDYAYRNTDFRLDIPFLIAKDVQALEILSAKSLIDDIAGMQIRNIVDSSDLISEVPMIPIYEFIDDFSTVGTCGIIPLVTLAQDENGENIREISGVALFDDDYIYSYLDEKQTKTLGVMLNKSKTGNVIDENDAYTQNYNMVSSKVDITPNINNNKLVFDIDFKMELELIQNPDKNNNQDFFENEQLQQNITQAVRRDVLEFLDYVKQNNMTDFLGLGNMVYRKYPSYFNEISSDFYKIIENLEYNLNVECKIIGSGLISSSIR